MHIKIFMLIRLVDMYVWVTLSNRRCLRTVEAGS